MNAPELLDALPKWTSHSPMPILESPHMSWRDEPYAAVWCGEYSGRRTVVVVGDAAHYERVLEARNAGRQIARNGLRDVLTWLEAAGVRVW